MKKKYFVTVSLFEVEATSPREAAQMARGELVHNPNTVAQVRVYNPPEKDDKGTLKITSSRWTYGAAPVEVKPEPAKVYETVSLGYKPAKPPEVPAGSLEAPEFSLGGAMREVFGS